VVVDMLCNIIGAIDAARHPETAGERAAGS